MKLWSDSFQDGQPIPAAYALGKPNTDSHVEFSDNLNPHLAWSGLPEGAKSLALICDDVDCPTSPDNVNREGLTVPADLRRADFYHWALVDLAADAGPIAEGEFSRGVTAKGKDSAQGPRRTRQGLNNYTQWFEGDADMAGNYFGYDGPCPPWNDERVHHYHFTLYALEVHRVAVDGTFDAPAVLKAIEGHVLDKATIVGTYAIYSDAT